MHVGIIGGTGPAGLGLAARLALAGVDVTVGSRDAARAEDKVASVVAKWPARDLAVKGAVNEDAAAADVVVLATPWDSAAATAADHADALADKVVVSMANALAKVGDEFQPLVLARGSVAAAVQAAVPAAHVGAAFHHLPARLLGDLGTPLEADVLVCADHPEALDATIDLVHLVPGLRAVEAGSLSSAAPIEAFTAVLLSVNVRYKSRTSLRLTGLHQG